MAEPITFTAMVASVKTLADGGLRVAFDLPEDSAMQAAQLIECKRWGAVQVVTATPLKKAINGEQGTNQAGRGQKSQWTPAQESGDDGDTQAGGGQSG